MVRGQEVGHLQGNVKCDVLDMNWSEKVTIRGSTVVALRSAGAVIVALDSQRYGETLSSETPN